MSETDLTRRAADRGYVSPCAAHYFRHRYERMDAGSLADARRVLREGLFGLEEELQELAALPEREAAKLRGDLEHEAMHLRAKLAAVEELLDKSSGCRIPFWRKRADR